MTTIDYPSYHQELQRGLARLGQALPAEMKGFGQLHRAAVDERALSGPVRELIALGIAIAVRCDGCIAFHVHDALRAGAGRDEVLDTIGVAVMMGGGPAAVYGTQALEALEQFEGALR